MGFVLSSIEGSVPVTTCVVFEASRLKPLALIWIPFPSAAMSLQQAEQEGWILFQAMSEIACTNDWYGRTPRCGRADICVTCALTPRARCKAFVPREEMLRRLGTPTTEMLRTVGTRRLSIITSRGWRFFYRSFLPVIKEQAGNYKEDLACEALPPMTLRQLTITAQQRLLRDTAMWVRRTNTFGVEDIVVKAVYDAGKHASWQRERCSVLVRNLFPTDNEAEQAQVALAMKGLGHVAEYHRIRQLATWSRAATAVVPLPEDTLHNDVAQYWYDATASSDEEKERHGKSWGRSTDEELQAEFIANRDTSYFDNIKMLLGWTESSDSSD